MEELLLIKNKYFVFVCSSCHITPKLLGIRDQCLINVNEMIDGWRLLGIFRVTSGEKQGPRD